MTVHWKRLLPRYLVLTIFMMIGIAVAISVSFNVYSKLNRRHIINSNIFINTTSLTGIP